MYGVLLVDDEPLVRKGLAAKVDWGRYDMVVVDEAANGEEGLQKAADPAVHLIITDVKMPGIDGLEFIRRAIESRGDLRFVVVSGYDEFDFAQEAMRFGVRHYLLKPTKPAELDRVLTDAARELREMSEDRELLQRMKDRLEQNMPLIREQFFRDLLMGRLHTRAELAGYVQFFQISEKSFSLLILSVGHSPTYEELLTLRWVVRRGFGGPDAVPLSAIVKDAVVVLVDCLSRLDLLAHINGVKERYRRLVPKSVTVTLGGNGSIADVPDLYAKASEFLRYRFHYGADSVITEDDAVPAVPRMGGGDVEYYKDQVAMAIRCGDEESLDRAMESFLKEMRQQRLPRGDVCGHAVDLLLSVARADDYENLIHYMSHVTRVQNVETIDEIGRIVADCCRPRLVANYGQLRSKRGVLVERVKARVNEHLSDPQLSLKWLAENLVYANVDYLSKSFKRETGENFNHYVTRLRLERAKELLKGSLDVPISQIAREVGFGEGAQYFSRVFRNVTGQTPTGYRADAGG